MRRLECISTDTQNVMADPLDFRVSDLELRVIRNASESGFLIPYYVAEGKNQLVIGIGCTGGQHRSVTIANCLYEDLQGQGDYALKIYHRDAKKKST